MAKRRQVRARDERAHVIARGERKVSLFGKARKIATCRENCEIIADLRAISKMRAMLKTQEPPIAFVRPREPHRGTMSREDIERKLAEPAVYPVAPPLGSGRVEKTDRVARELAAALENRVAAKRDTALAQLGYRR